MPIAHYTYPLRGKTLKGEDADLEIFCHPLVDARELSKIT